MERRQHKDYQSLNVVPHHRKSHVPRHIMHTPHPSSRIEESTLVEFFAQQSGEYITKAYPEKFQIMNYTREDTNSYIRTLTSLPLS